MRGAIDIVCQVCRRDRLIDEIALLQAQNRLLDAGCNEIAACGGDVPPIDEPYFRMRSPPTNSGGKLRV